VSGLDGDERRLLLRDAMSSRGSLEPFFEGEVSNTAFMAEIMGLGHASWKVIGDEAKRGVLFKAGHGAYFWRKSIASYCQHLRDIIANRRDPSGQSTVAANVSLKAAQERLTQIRADQLMGKLIQIDELEAAWADVMVNIRQTVMSIPGRMRFGLPHMTAHDQQVLEGICRDVLEEVASGKAPMPKQEP